jgi:type I restriction-modification system DNA methylase subunit
VVAKNKVFAEQYGLNEIDKAANAVNLLISGKTIKIEPSATNQTPTVLQITNDDGGAYMGIDYSYPNQYALNKAIESLISARGDNYQNYTAEEKIFLSKYSGYGGLSEFGEAGKGAFFEYYTPRTIIEKMWALAYKYGYNNGPILEPSCATGEFFQFAKPDTRKVGYEISEWSAKICRILYPNAEIHVQPFEQVFIKNNFTIRDKTDELEKFDLVIGNPPYGDFSVVQSRFMAMGEKDHVRPNNYVEYFLRRSVDLLNPGGILVFIIGAAIQGGGVMFLDSGPSTVKAYLSETTEFLEAYRLPDTVFERTGVTSDIIVLRKK